MGHAADCRPLLLQFGAFLLVTFTGTPFFCSVTVSAHTSDQIRIFNSLAATAQVVTITYPKASVSFDEGNRVDLTVRVSSSGRCPHIICFVPIVGCNQFDF